MLKGDRSVRRQISRTTARARDAKTDQAADAQAPLDVGIAMTIYGRDRKGQLVEIPCRSGEADSFIPGAETRH